jgi:Fe-S-cluster-containing dehydrogenase component
VTKYRVVIDSERCVDCGISVGRCPTHAKLLAQVLKPDSIKLKQGLKSMGVFDEKIYSYVITLVNSCPEHALIIKKVEKPEN